MKRVVCVAPILIGAVLILAGCNGSQEVSNPTAAPAATAITATPSPVVQAECPRPTACPGPTGCPAAPTCPEPVVCPTCPEPITCPTCPTCPEAVVCPTCPQPIECTTCPVCPACFCPTCPEAMTCPNGGDDFAGKSLCELLNGLDQFEYVDLSTWNAVDCGGAYECEQECGLDSWFERDVEAVADFLRWSPPVPVSIWQVKHCIGQFYRP